MAYVVVDILQQTNWRAFPMSVGSGDEGLSYYAVAVARRNDPSVNFYTLKGKVACFPGEFINLFFNICHFLMIYNVFDTHERVLSLTINLATF